MPASAATVAVRAGVVTAHVVYTMGPGDVRGDGTATPARRVALGLTDATSADLSADGLQLLGNAINWADVTAAARLSDDENAAQTAEYAKGIWAFNDYRTRNGHNSTPSVIRPGVDDGVLADDTIVKAKVTGVNVPPVAADGASALRFPGWDDGTPGNGAVDQNASRVRVPHQDRFNPLGKRFKISVYVRPQAQYDDTESPNIIQKGRVDEGNKHQWKVSINAGGMTPVCTFQGAKSKTDPQLVRTEVFAGRAGRLTIGDRYRLTCELSPGGQAILHVYHWVQGVGFVDVNTAGWTGTAKSGIWVAPTDEISIGKKPRDTKAGDAYAGDIDNIRISRWEPVQ